MPKPLTEDQFWSKVDKSGECWIWTGAKFPFGYGNVRMNGERYAHRVAWTMARGPIPADLYVLHVCDVPACVNPDHLWLGTKAENNADRKSKGRNGRAVGGLNGRYTHPETTARGERNGFSKLSEADVREIRARRAAGEKLREIAELFGVAKQTVHSIVHGRLWAHVPAVEL